MDAAYIIEGGPAFFFFFFPPAEISLVNFCFGEIVLVLDVHTLKFVLQQFICISSN